METKAIIIIGCAALLTLLTVLHANECEIRTMLPNCAGNGDSYPSCAKTIVTGIPPVCGTAYRRGRETWSNSATIPQSKCVQGGDPSSHCTQESADCEYWTEGTCSNYDKLECWAKLLVQGGNQYTIVSANAEGGIKYTVTDVDQVTTVGPILRGNGSWAKEE